jgi:DNA replication protein DnaC
VVFVGPVGVGKTMLAQCLGSASVRAGHSVVFVRTDALLAELGQARADRSYDKVFRRYLAPDLVILDDFGRAPRSAIFPCGLRDPPLAAAAAGRS